MEEDDHPLMRRMFDLFDADKSGYPHSHSDGTASRLIRFNQLNQFIHLIEPQDVHVERLAGGGFQAYKTV